MENFVLIIGAICIGYILNRLNIFSSDAPNTLNKYVIYISIPAMIFLQIPKLTFSMDIVILADAAPLENEKFREVKKMALTMLEFIQDQK